MDDGPIHRLCYVNLDRPKGQQSNEPPMLLQHGRYIYIFFYYTWSDQEAYPKPGRTVSVVMDRVVL